MGDGQLKPLIDRLMHAVSRDGGQLSDAQLLERFVQAKDEAAFESLLWRHGPMVLGLCQRMLRHRHDAEDVFQAVFLVLVRKAHSISRRDHLASWLYRVAYRLAVKARARMANRADAGSAVELLPAPEEPDALLAADCRAALDDALGRLPEKYRAPLVLHYLEGMTVEQAAEEIGCPTGTVSGRLNRARELLRRRLGRRGVLLSTALVPGVLAEAGKAAAVPAGLASATLSAVRGLAGGSATAGTVSATALALAESADRLVPGARWKIATLALVLLGLGGLGAGLARQYLVAPPESGPLQAAPAAPAQPAEAVAKEARPPAVAPVEDQDPLPPGARVQMGSRRYTFGSSLDALALSPDGATVAGLGETNSVVFWDAGTGKFQTVVSAYDVPVRLWAVDFSPDGTAVAVGDSKGRAVVVPTWRTRTERAIAIDERHDGNVQAVRFAPDGQTVASGGDDRLVRLWIPQTGQVLHRLAGHCGEVLTLAFAPDGKTLASAGQDGEIRLWSTATGALLRLWSGHAGAVRAVAFSTDGKVLASAGADRHVRLWRPDAELAYAYYDLRTVAPLALVFVDEKRLAVASEAGAVRLFDLAANKLLCNYRGMLWSVKTMACSRDGRWLVAGGQDGVFIRWDVATGKADKRETPGHTGPVWCADVSPDGRVIASGGLDGTVRLWSTASGKALETLRPDWQTNRRLGYVSKVAFVLGGRGVAAAGADGVIHLWDRQQGTRARWPAHRGQVTALASTQGGRFLVSAGEDGAVCLWRVATREKVRTYGGVGAAVWNLAVSPDGERLAGVANDGTVHLWELATGRALGPVAPKKSGLNVAAFSPVDGRLGASGLGAGLHLWKPARASLLPPETWQSEDSKAVAIAFAPDGTVALAGRDNAIRLWQVNGARQVGRFAGHQMRINSLVFTPDGKGLVSASDDGTVVIWDMPRRDR
jgi:RNA polymerase sigma factor (sigma-70 family)